MTQKLAQKEIVLGHCETIEIPDRAIVHEHKETKAKYTAFAFIFSDGTPGTLVLTKGIKTTWQPSQDIKRIIIEFNENTN